MKKQASKKALHRCEKDELIEMIIALQEKLSQKKAQLAKVKSQLNNTRSKVIKLKDTVIYQRKRILELHREEV